MRGQDRPTSPRAARRRETRQAFLDGARALARRGAGDPLDPAALAAEAGVSRTLFYRYFPSREAFALALLETLHAGAPQSEPCEESPQPPLVAFFEALSAPLEAEAELARQLIPLSHMPGPVARARARRRAAALAHLVSLIGPCADAEARAAFLMDAYLGIQLAWAKESAAKSLLSRVRRDMRWAVAGMLADLDPQRP